MSDFSDSPVNRYVIQRNLYDIHEVKLGGEIDRFKPLEIVFVFADDYDTLLTRCEKAESAARGLRKWISMIAPILERSGWEVSLAKKRLEETKWLEEIHG